jgi:hypothetical protein
VLADPLIEDRLPRHPLEVDAVIDHAEAASRQLGGANMHLPTHVNALAMNSFVNRIRPMSGRAA